VANPRTWISPNSNVIWNLYGFHMGTHVAYIWYFMWFAPDHPYGRHMGKPRGFGVGTIWYTHVVYRCETHMGKPYVCHMSDMWLTHMTPISVVGCNHMKFHTFTISSSYIDPIWTPYTTLVVRCLLYTVLFLAWQQHCTCTLQASCVQIKSNQIRLLQTTTCSTFVNFMLQGKGNKKFLALTSLYCKANLPRWLCCLLCRA